MTLKDYILTYERDGKLVANLFDYYEMFIKPLDKRWEYQSYYTNNLVLCFFKDHADINPSMGYIAHRRLKGVKVCHCFGCGKTADVIRLNQIISSQYYGKELTEKESCLDLANKFDIPLEDFDELSDEDFGAQFERKMRLVDRLSARYTIRDFSSGLLAERKKAKDGVVDLNRINSECVKMIATTKQLYS